MTVINTNVRALMVRNAMQTNDRSLTDAMQQLSTGKRINSAKDDAAGLAISTRMTQQIQSLAQAVRNAGDAISLVQTAEGATQQITDALQRMRELSIEAINDTYGNDQRGYLDLEFQQLKQEIVQIANNTEWNGFPILNGTAGQSVGPALVQRVSASSQFNGALSYTPTIVSHTGAVGTLTTTGSPLKEGSLAITMGNLTAGAGSCTATFTMKDGKTVNVTGQVTTTGGQNATPASAMISTITFSNTALGANFSVVSTDPYVAATTSPTVAASGGANKWATGNTVNINVVRSFESLDRILGGDLTVNGVAINAFSPRDSVITDLDPSTAIAKVAQINAKSASTGVKATISPTVMTGAAMSSSVLQNNVPSGSITVNGIPTPIFSSVQGNVQASRAAAAEAINAISSATGVVAIDTYSDAGGITLQAADGRNITVGFNSSAPDVDFAKATGVKQGIQSGSYSLSASGDKPIVIGTTQFGAIDHAGLQVATFNADSSSVGTRARATLAATVAPVGLRAGDLVINGVEIPASVDQTTIASGVPIPYQDASSATAIAAAINAKSNLTGVVATAHPAEVSGSFGSDGVRHDLVGTPPMGTLWINGIPRSIDLSSQQSILDSFQTDGATAVPNKAGNGITLLSKDGRNLSVQYATVGTPAQTLTLQDYGLGGSDATEFDGSTTPNVHFAGVSLTSTMSIAPQVAGAGATKGKDAPGTLPGSINVSAGANGFGVNSNFEALGFVTGSFGGTGGLDPSAPRVGRLSFQIGASAGQTIHIDLADLGSKGPITGAITADVDDPNHPVNISTSAAAQNVLSILDGAMNGVNATRASMGAIMNRMQQVITNLSNVGTNASASRSQVEDADYAKASSDMARAQIIAQAATAVLAQANTSQQTVLKLLQG